MSDDSRPAANRLDRFTAAVSEFDVDRHGDTVAIRVVTDADEFRVELTELFELARQYDLVAFDGWIGGQGVGSLRFKPIETFDE